MTSLFLGQVARKHTDKVGNSHEIASNHPEIAGNSLSKLLAPSHFPLCEGPWAWDQALAG